MFEKNKKSLKIFFITLTACTLFLAVFHFASAQGFDPFGGRQVDLENQLGLGREDPRIIAARVIRVALGFLGIIFIGLILYAGYLWMTAAGQEDKIDRAKKILISAVIGLLIILASFAIATFILNRLLEATGATTGGGGGSCGGGPACSPGEVCCSGSCQAPPCLTGGGPTPPIPCDGNLMTTLCDPNNSICTAANPNSFCDNSSCLCRPTGGVGDPCDDVASTPTCEPNDARCSQFLRCDTTDCTCQGGPVIEWLSPVDANGTPNGAPGNFVTIGGRYFGTTTGSVYFADASGSTTVPAAFPGPPCIANWTENQIIVIVPNGARNGEIRVARADGQTDLSGDNRGPQLADFEVNSTVRPGLCLATPSSGYFNDNFLLNGANMSGANQTVYFGNLTASTSVSAANWTANSVTATVPNVRGGQTSVFVSVNNNNSNSLNFSVLIDSARLPTIDYIDPGQGPVGQYITIYGRNFKDYQLGASVVQFDDGGVPVAAGIDFPPACQNRWWHDTYITVKVPPQATPVGAWNVTVTNRDGQTSAPADFSVTTGRPTPGLCALVPKNGPVGTAVGAFGDRFGSSQGAGYTTFYNNQNGVVVPPWANQQVQSNVPAGAATGPFTLTNDSGDVSNSLPFFVGKCTAAQDCETGEECCSGGSFDGICRPSGSCGQSGTANACTFGWSFSTTIIATSTTCAGFSGNAAQCLAAGACPNSPGQCQTSTGQVQGSCGDAYCNTANPVCGGNCVYDGNINKCALSGSGSSCDLTSTTVLPGLTASCRSVGASPRWQINSGGASCPLGTFRDTNNWCTVGTPSSPLACDTCATGFACQSGQCVIDRTLCPAGSNCQGNLCVSTGSICECCCRTANSAQDCCAGLTCEPGGCGAGAPDYGLCTGCRVVVNGAVDQAASDRACNCTPGSASRYCDLSVPSGVCRDAAGQNQRCYDPANGATCNPADPPCQPGLFCDPASCTCRQPASAGQRCYDPANGATCNPADPPCASGLSCDPAAGCTCVRGTSTTTPGALCVDATAPSCTIGAANCGADYQCLNQNQADCRCCCLPGTTNAAGLGCVADKSPCTGGTRGLYCGCTDDVQCGGSPPATAGCGLDACCHGRPSVTALEPPDGATDVCRNPLIKATFTEAMDPASFNSNLIVLGDYGADICPEGTTYLLGGNYLKLNAFAKLWFNIKNWFAGNNARAQTMSGNFCAVTGLVSGYNNLAGEGILTWTPGRALDPGRDYWVIVRGDNLTTVSSAEGVRSRFGVGMNGPDNRTFNNVAYGGRIWTFRTMPATATNDGICRLTYVSIDPVSYTYTTAAPDATDDGLTNPLDATTRDNDKVFTAYAKSSAGADIVPVAGYRWDWTWTSENPAVASLGIQTAAAVTPAAAVLVAQNQKDAKTYLRAEAKITEDLIMKPSTLGNAKSGRASIHVFLCANPWPPLIDPANWPWRDSGANCDINIATCPNNNFELYYCRDSGETGTASDLPAILVDPVVRGQAAAPPNQPLKELFFMREDLPGLTTLAVSDLLYGSSIYASWGAVAGASSYKLYYGASSGNYSDSLEVAAPATDAIVSGLTTGKRYYFAVTALYAASRAESKYSNEVLAVPTDQTPPSAPAGLTASSTVRGVDLLWTINSSSDVAGYRVYYGTTPSFGRKEDVGKVDSVALTGLATGTTYYFALGAYDKYNNEATTSPAISATPN